jgi:CysZ protein
MLFIPVLGVILVLPFSVTAASRATLEEMIKDKNLELPNNRNTEIKAQ